MTSSLHAILMLKSGTTLRSLCPVLLSHILNFGDPIYLPDVVVSV